MALKFYIFSEHGTSLFLAQLLAAENHTVRFHVVKPAYRFRGRGLVDTTRDPEPRRGEIVVIDEDGHAAEAARWRRRGHLVLGGNKAESWEVDRAEGSRIMEQHGIRVSETQSFTDFAAARKFMEGPDADGEWFFKPDDAPSYLTGNARSREAMLRMLADAEDSDHGIKRFELQRKVVGTEVDLDVWMDGSKVVLPHEIDFEEKHALAGNIGPRTGCQSNLLWDCEDPIIEATISKFEGALLESRYVGVAAINCIVTPTGQVYGLEFSNRFGYDSTQAFLARLAPGRIGEQLADFLAGYLDEFETLPDRPYALTMKLSIPPAPLDDPDKARESRGRRLDPALLGDDFYGEDLMRNGAGELVFAGTEGNLGCLAAVGHSVPLLRTSLLERAGELDINGLQYRNDPVSTAETRIDALVRLGLVERIPKFSPNVHDLTEEARLGELQRLRHHEDDGDNPHPSAGIVDSIAGGGDDLNEGSVQGSGVDVAAPAGGTGSSASDDDNSAATP